MRIRKIIGRAYRSIRRALAPLLPEPTVPPPAVQGYTDRTSYVPGEEIRFHVSCDTKNWDLEVVRVGAERKRYWTKEGLPGKSFPTPDDASSHGCRWPCTFSLIVPPSWPPGYYVGRMTATQTDGTRSTSSLFFIIRSSEPGVGTYILLQLATNTYNAYTNWGGYSLYAYNGRRKVQGHRVSFDRPIWSQFHVWEQPFVEWAERNGYSLDYAANADLECHPDLLKRYRLVLSVGHDEYWSAPMRDHLETFIAQGGNVAFLSGNTCCWQVRSEDEGRALVCWKQDFLNDPMYTNGNHQRLSTLWSHHLIARPENQLTGVGFLHGGFRNSHGQFLQEPAEYTVHRPDHWLLHGTGLKRGAVFGAEHSIVGYECDGCDLDWTSGLPVPTHRDGTPMNFTVVATCPARWGTAESEWYDRWEKNRLGNATMGSYTKGGTVVTVGSTDWAHGLQGADPSAVRVTRNILDRLTT